MFKSVFVLGLFVSFAIHCARPTVISTTCLVYSAMDCEVSFPIAKVYSMMNEINFSEETESENKYG